MKIFWRREFILTILSPPKFAERAPKEYEKPWMRRRRIADEKIYRSKKKAVNELVNYIKFVKDAREARDEEWAYSKSDQD